MASPVVSALIAVGGVLASILFTNKREKDRLEHERKTKQVELEAEHAARFRDERINAYRRLLAATTSAHVDREAAAELSEAYAEISLLAGSVELDRAAARVWVMYGKTQKVADKTKKDPESASATDFAQALDKARVAKEKFLELARKELRVEGFDPD